MGGFTAILSHYAPRYTNEDLLTLYAFTGGVPKYVELLMDAGKFDHASMVEAMTEVGSPFLTEGQTLLSEAFGRHYGTYFSILSLISQGKTRYGELVTALGGNLVAGHLKRLEEQYELIERVRPFGAKPTSQSVRFAIRDPFLRFWFRFIYRHRFLIEQGESRQIAPLIERDYPTYSGLALEEYFRKKAIESGKYSNVSRWWKQKSGKEQSEIDLVALQEDGRGVYLAEVKRQAKSFSKKEFLEKMEHFRTDIGKGLTVKTDFLSLEDM